MMAPKVFSVSDVNRYIQSLLEDDVILRDIFLSGEVSNLTLHSSGHIYFTMKDNNAALACVMFKGNALGLRFKPANGLNVIAYGRVSAYMKTGQVQLYVELLEPGGVGALYVAFEQLKQKLEAEGLFAAARKRPVPAARCVAIVTSPTGAAVRDIIRVAKRRDKSVRLALAPAKVQGDDAPDAICDAIALVNRWGKADVMIVGRGGGSLEDLWAFNNERVARAIAASKVPVISAVGHETDFTIADFVADLRASTPSAAAELAVADASALAERLAAGRVRMDGVMEAYFERRFDIESMADQLNRELARKLSQSRTRLAAGAAQLTHLSPLHTLSRGYGLVTKETGAAVTRIADIQTGDKLRTRLADGTFASVVTDVKIIESNEAEG